MTCLRLLSVRDRKGVFVKALPPLLNSVYFYSTGYGSHYIKEFLDPSRSQAVRVEIARSSLFSLK